MKYTVRHSTCYKYVLSVSNCYNVAYVLPRNTIRQQVDAIDIKISPMATTHNTRTDCFGNQFLQFSIEKDHSELELTITSSIDVKDVESNINLDFGNPCSYVKYLLENTKSIDFVNSREYMLDSIMVQ